MNYSKPLSSLIEYLQSRIYDLNFSVKNEGLYRAVTFPLGDKSNYDIEFDSYDTDDDDYAYGHLYSVPRNIKKEDDGYFWKKDIEIHEYESKEELTADLHDCLIKILTMPSRIIQKKKGLFWNFQCDYKDSGNWKELYYMDYLRATYKVVKIEDNEKTYYGFPFIKQSERTIQSA